MYDRSYANGALVAVHVALVALLGGCSKESTGSRWGEWSPVMTNPPVVDVKVYDDGKGVPELKPDDIVVAVDGEPLTRAMIDVKLKQMRWSLDRNKRMRRQEKDNAYKVFGKSLIKNWVRNRILIRESRRLGCATERQIRDAVEKGLDRYSVACRMNLATLDKKFPGGLYWLSKDIEDNVWVSSYISNHVHSTVVVDDALVESIKKPIKEENAAIAASNKVIYGRMEMIRREALKPGADFGALADKYSEDPQLVKDGTGYWGEFFASALEAGDPARQIFDLDPGMVSEIIDDGEGYMIAKVLEINPPPAGSGSRESSYSVARIYLEHGQETVFANEAGIKADLEMQYFGKAVAARVDELRKSAKIVYPHGEDFWSSRKRNEARLKTRAEREKEIEEYRKDRERRKLEKASQGATNDVGAVIGGKAE